MVQAWVDPRCCSLREQRYRPSASINEGRFLSKELTWRSSEDFPCSFSETGNAFGVWNVTHVQNHPAGTDTLPPTTLVGADKWQPQSWQEGYNQSHLLLAFHRYSGASPFFSVCSHLAPLEPRRWCSLCIWREMRAARGPQRTSVLPPVTPSAFNFILSDSQYVRWAQAVYIGLV